MFTDITSETKLEMQGFSCILKKRRVEVEYKKKQVQTVQAQRLGEKT